MNYQIVVDPSKQDIDDVLVGLRAFNDPFVDHIKETHIGMYAVDEKGIRVGGIVSRLWGNWMYIRFLWVEPSLSGKGIGQTLMEKMEAYAIEQGCHSSMVDTFSFQAKPFYEKLGYECKMSLDEYPIEHQLHFLTKHFTKDFTKD
ncbi:GNAT family N-acetyltransferase [Enterovibrio calviensis]|uniref:GNAT family N-acetyltransferase n=1 Tax=Enterovibrio calviensis TaxID=91359 RepID=UPI003736A77E